VGGIMHKYFNPYKMFVGAFLPNWLLKSTDISSSEKLTYARLCQFSGKDGRCFPKIETIGQEIGLEDRQVQRNLQRLEEVGLIQVIRNPPKVNEYRFIWCQARQVNGVRQDTLKVTSVTPSIYEENHIRESTNTIMKDKPSLVTSFVKKELIKSPPMPRNFIVGVMTYYGNAQGWQDEDTKKAYQIFARICKQLFILSDGNLEAVKKAIDWVKAQRYPSWTLNAVLKHWNDVKKGNKEDLLPEL
jgi:predicted transcriptional regulator